MLTAISAAKGVEASTLIDSVSLKMRNDVRKDETKPSQSQQELDNGWWMLSAIVPSVNSEKTGFSSLSVKG